MNALDYITTGSNGFSLAGATDFQRLRARRTPRAMNPKQTDEDWQHPDIIEIRGALASSTSTRLPDALDIQTTSTAVLTIDNPKADVRIGDRIRAMPDDGRLWEGQRLPFERRERVQRLAAHTRNPTHRMEGMTHAGGRTDHGRLQ